MWPSAKVVVENVRAETIFSENNVPAETCSTANNLPHQKLTAKCILALPTNDSKGKGKAEVASGKR
jgi:hypothetical protein